MKPDLTGIRTGGGNEWKMRLPDRYFNTPRSVILHHKIYYLNIRMEIKSYKILAFKLLILNMED